MDEEKKSLAQNEPVSPAEAPEEANKAEAPQEGGEKAEAAQEPAGEATGAVPEEATAAPRGRETIMLDEELVTPEPTMVAPGVAPVAEKQVMAEVAAPKPAKKSYKGLIITIIVTVVLAVGAVTVWWLTTKDKAEETVEDSNSTEVEKPGEETEPEKGEIVSVDINDPIVQEVYREFYFVPSILEPSESAEIVLPANATMINGTYDSALTFEYYTGKNGDITDLMLMLSYLDRGSAQIVPPDTSEQFGMIYYDTTATVERVLKDFGRMVDFAQFDELCSKITNVHSGNCYTRKYDAETKVLSSTDWGRYNLILPTYVDRSLIRAESDGKHLYLYEKVALAKFDEESGKYKIYRLPSNFGYASLDEWAKQEGTELEMPVLGQSETSADYYVDQFKWTFKKNAEGNWVFESLTRAE